MSQSQAFMPPRHYWPGARLTRDRLDAVFPCGLAAAGGPFLVTNDPTSTTCKRCIRSSIVQDALDAGVSQVLLADDELVRLGLLRRRA
jgi:hypothetical protein